ncbi:methyltransferase domain-containing protein [Candidatus Babeliales bacterium]|nr:methyltransferase domain-containing protein [Candidatus Babeliales bacterium]
MFTGNNNRLLGFGFVFLLSLSVHAAGDFEAIGNDEDEIETPTCSQFFDDLADYGTECVEIARGMWQDATTVSALTPSSPWLAKEVARDITKRKEQRILEIGFGPGSVTKYIIKKMHPKSTLDGVEIMEDLYKYAERRFPKTEYEKVNLVCGDFVTWKPTYEQYDVIITTVPFTKLPFEVVKGILEKILKLLKPNGKLSCIALMGSRTLGYCSWDREKRRTYAEKINLLDSWKRENFTQETPVRIWLNLTSAYAYHLTKNA